MSMNLSDCLDNSIWASFLMIVWFHTDAFPEYLSLLGLRKRIDADGYEREKLNNHLLNYPVFLLISRNSFLTRLISCPFCIGFWICLAFCLENSIINIAGSYVSCMFIYFVFGRIYEESH